LPDLKAVRTLEQGEKVDPAREWAAQSGKVSAIVTGPLENPVLIGPEPVIKAWEGKVSMISAQATGKGPRAFPDVQLSAAAMPKTGDRRSRLMTAQAGQTVLFLLTMLLAGMVLSNLVEEKGNKIIEILAAAIPMDSVFFGKLFAMLAISFVGIGVWALAGLAFMLDPGSPIRALPDPAVGWPLFLALGIVYFAMAYLLIGSVFLAIGSMATTVREVQTLSMPVTMLQLMVFFLASYAMTQPGSPFELFAAIFPFSSPFAMLARAAQDQALLPQGLAILWQSLCVVLFVRVGARLFRTRVLKSGPSGAKGNRKGFFSRLRPSRSGPASIDNLRVCPDFALGGRGQERRECPCQI